MKRKHQKTTRENELTHAIEVEQVKCPSDKCDYTTVYRWDMKKHLEKCLHVVIDRALQEREEYYQFEIAQLHAQYQQQLMEKDNSHQVELSKCELLLARKEAEIERLTGRLESERLTGRLETMETQMKQSNELVSRLAERPTTLVTNSHNNNTHNHILNVLTDAKQFLEQTDPDRIQAIARAKLEPYFWQGQKGMAEFVTDNVVCTVDDKMIAACTDFSRKKVKYLNDRNELDEDIGACKLVKRIAPPIKAVASELHTTITEQLRRDLKENKIGAFMADGKTTMADNALLDIHQIDNDDHNSDFRMKLCSLIKV